MRIYLIRHPRPLIAAGLCYGQLDVDCEDPQPIAARLRARLPAGIPVISSPLRRARRLAEALSPTFDVDTRLSEINFGQWEGQAWDNIERAALDAWAADVTGFAPPGGESVDRLRARAIAFAATLDLPEVALVTHCGVIRALCGYWQELPTEEWTQLKVEFGGMTVIEV